MERLQYDPPMATKIVVLQLCGVALEVNPCSARMQKYVNWNNLPGSVVPIGSIRQSGQHYIMQEFPSMREL